MIVGVTEREETDGLLVRFRLSQKYNEREPSEVELRMRDMICLHTRRRYFWGSSKDDALLKRDCLLYTSPSPRDMTISRMPSSA